MRDIIEQGAEILYVGEAKSSKTWTNVFVQLKFADGRAVWLYLSEHVDKVQRLQLIPNFVKNIFKIGDTIDVHYKIVQSANKSTKLVITSLANHRPKK